jgi:hypothetical protein
VGAQIAGVCIEQELEALRASVAELESRKTNADDWRRIEARAFLALLGGQLQLTSLQRDMIDHVRSRSRDWSWQRTHLEVGRLVETLNELRTVKTCAQSRVFELEATRAQRVFSNVP